MKMLILKGRQNHLRILFLILGGTTFMSGAVEPMMHVGIKVTLKDGSVIPIYVSKEKVLFNSAMYLSDLKEAELILSKIKKRIR